MSAVPPPGGEAILARARKHTHTQHTHTRLSTLCVVVWGWLGTSVQSGGKLRIFVVFLPTLV
jgi:hypothetical protein